MARVPKGLQRRLRQAQMRVKKENEIITQAQSRRRYWQGVVRFLEDRMEHRANGQMEMGV